MQREEFMRLSPRYFAALVKEHQARLRRADEMTEIMVAQVVAMVRRCGFVQFDEQLSAEDFMPSRWREEAAKPKRINHKEIAEGWRMYLKLAAGYKPKQ